MQRGRRPSRLVLWRYRAPGRAPQGDGRRFVRTASAAYAVLSPETSSFCLRRLANWRCASPGRAPRISARLDRSNDGQDHTVLPYASFLLRPRASQDLSAVRTTRLARSSRGSAQSTAPPCDLTSATAPLASTAARSAVRDDVRPPLSPDQDGRHIRQIRISVKWNILTRGD